MLKQETAKNTLETLETIRAILEDKKGENVQILDLRGLSSITDYFVLATGASAPHLQALAETVERELKRIGRRPFRVAGTPKSEWIAVDYFDVVLHLFSPRARRHYALEELWGDAPKMAGPAPEKTVSKEGVSS